MVHGKKIISFGAASVLFAALGLSAPVSAAPLDLTLVAAHASRHDIKKLGMIAGWTQPTPLWQGQDWRIALRHEVELSGWRVPDARDLVEFGYSPVFRLEHAQAGGAPGFFLEASIGVRLLSHTRLAPDVTMSTAFQFADMIGAGWQWGQSTLGVRLQHESNASIKEPNPGINFTEVYYRYRF